MQLELRTLQHCEFIIFTHHNFWSYVKSVDRGVKLILTTEEICLTGVSCLSQAYHSELNLYFSQQDSYSSRNLLEHIVKTEEVTVTKQLLIDNDNKCRFGYNKLVEFSAGFIKLV